MRLGVMLGAERGRYATKVERLEADARAAEADGFSSVWIPQVPDDFDALTAATLVAKVTERIEIATAVVPVQPRHPISLAQQALSVQAVAGGRLSLGLGVSHHWVIDEMFGLPYETPVAELRDHLDVLVPALGDGPGVVSVDDHRYHVRYPLDITDIAPTPILLAALGPAMLRLAGERTDGTILWMADERAIGDHIAPAITKAAEAAGRKPPRVVAGVPVCLCSPDEVEEATDRTNRLLSEAEVSPNYQKLLDRGDARQIGDLLAAGTEEMILARLRSFASAGATDVSIRVVPIGADRDAKLASSRRTRDFLASLDGRVV